MVCEAWAMQGYGTPPAIYLVYALKVGLYIGGWMLFARTTDPQWWLLPSSFQKAILWSMLFEILGLGCGSGPLTGRYYPPFGGALYFLRPGTTKLPLFAGAPVIGRRTRGFLDVGLYALLLASLVRALLISTPTLTEFAPIVAILAVLGVLDKTLFLAARGEHYWVTTVCFLFGPSWIPGAKCVQLALWFWAGVSKLNHHFPAVVCVMTSNGPLTRPQWWRKKMYRNYPDDLRPSGLATIMAHAGTALEIGVPIAFLLTPLGAPPVVAIALMLMLHVYITSNVPMGVPIEWNFMVVYAGFALFWAHPDVSILSINPLLGAFLAVMLVAIPIIGNFFPKYVSFLLAMRYYAGNWAGSLWLLKGDAYKKLEKLTASAPWVYDQLDRFYDRATSVGLVGKVMAFRLMHLHGRLLPVLIPKAVERFEDYEWVDGEIIAGLALGYNFGEGHLHHEQLLASIQHQCGFEEGELRCIFFESQPLFGDEIEYRIADAKTGAIERGALAVKDLRARQPWSAL